MVESESRNIKTNEVRVHGGVKLTQAERTVRDEVVEKYFRHVPLDRKVVLAFLQLDEYRNFNISKELQGFVSAYARIVVTQWVSANISNRVPLPGSLRKIRKKLLDIYDDGLVKIANDLPHELHHSVIALSRRRRKGRRYRASDSVPRFVTSGAPGTLFALGQMVIGFRGPVAATHEREEILAQVYQSSKSIEHAKEAKSTKEFIVLSTREHEMPISLQRFSDRYTSSRGDNAWFYHAMRQYYECHNGKSDFEGRLFHAQDLLGTMADYMRDVAPELYSEAPSLR